MTRTLLGILVGFLLAALVASRLESVVATGVLCGYLFGASIGSLGVAWQRHVLRTRPRELMLALVVSFGFKLAGVLLGALTLRFVPAVAEVADWRGFIVAFAAAALICLVVGSLDNARNLLRSVPETVNKGEPSL